ncbi:major facilitator superfamily domain-containing protein [Limtongia smithiae]|uniref:major facilitator superfamily domain-containing protein n=1 Tax=Limtongia smithiae TaxID=1125753 RepID=UPI0034CDD66B
MGHRTIWPFNRHEVTMEMIAADPTCDPYYDPPDWKCPKWRLTLSFFWETIRKPPGERRYVDKIDRGILFYLMLSYWIKSLDQKNVSNAYVSGMKEDLALNSNEYNYFTTLFNCGYLIGSVPNQMILSKVRPSRLIPTCEVCWTICVMVLARATGAPYIYGFRFLQGIFESVCYPTMMMIIGSWYKPDEIAKRVIIWDMTGYMASMFSGYLQAGIYNNLNGVRGIAGWRWLFIIDGCISLPIAFYGYFAIPDFPDKCTAVWMTDRDIQYSLRRMAEVGKKGTQKMTVKRFLRIFTSWRFWAFITPYSVYITGAGDYMNLWLKAIGYDVDMINILPTIGYAIALVTGYFFAIISDLTRWRWQLAMICCIPYIFGNLVLGIWNVPFGLKFAANIIPFIGSSFFSQFMAWISEVFQDDTELRGYLPAIGNVIWYCMYAWFPVVAFPATKAPHYPWGYWAAFGCAVVNCGTIYTCHRAHLWDVKRRGLVKNKYGLYVDRAMLVDYSASESALSIEERPDSIIGQEFDKGKDVVAESYEVNPNVDIEKDSDLIKMNSKY